MATSLSTLADENGNVIKKEVVEMQPSSKEEMFGIKSKEFKEGDLFSLFAPDDDIIWNGGDSILY